MCYVTKLTHNIFNFFTIISLLGTQVFPINLLQADVLFLPSQIDNSAGGITVDSNAISPSGQVPNLDVTQNNIALINITNPTYSGVSVNNFTYFNIAEGGAVFNNSLNVGISLLGGAIYGNPNFHVGGNTANIILNQVTGVQMSNLNGVAEIFGNKAELIIANPYGITCAGCGFINTDKATLLAGTTSLQSDLSTVKMSIDIHNSVTSTINTRNNGNSNNAISDQNSNYGIIKIENANSLGHSGLVTSNPIALLARSVKVAEQLNSEGAVQMILGQNQIIYKKGGNELHKVEEVQNIIGADVYSTDSRDSTVSENSTIIALDTYNLGGIYGNQIFIESTEQGAGVRFVNEVISQETMQISSNGDIYYNELRGKEDITLTAAQKVQDIYINTNSNNISTQSEVVHTITLNHQDSQGKTVSGDYRIANNSTIYSDKSVNINADNAINSGFIYAKENINYNVNDTIINDYGSIKVEGSITAFNLGNFSKAFINSMGYIEAGTDLIIKADKITQSYINQNGQAQSHMIANNNINLLANVLNNEDSKIAAANDLLITAAAFNNKSSIVSTTNLSYIDSQGNVVAGEYRVADNSTIYSGKTTTIQATNVVNSGLMYAKENINFNVKDAILNDYGTLYAKDSIASHDLNNNAGAIVSGINTNNFSQAFINHMGYIQAGKDIAIKANEITNSREGVISDISTGNRDSHPGNINETVTVHLSYDEERDYRQSYIIAGRDINLSAQTITNHGSKIAAGNDLTIIAAILNNNSQVLKDSYKNYYMSWEKVGKNCNVVNHCEDTYGWVPRNYSSVSYRYDSAQLLAGNNITLGIVKQVNNGQIEGHADYNKIVDATSNYVGGSGQSSSVIKQPENISNILFNTGGNLFKPADPSSHYLIESVFTDVSIFKGSQYLFDRLGIGFYDEEIKNRRLMGDAYWESFFVQNQYERLTNTKFASDTIDLANKMQQLLNNAATVRSELNLTIGIALTPDQVNNLTSDIIWYIEEEIINAKGEKETVLKPQIYLANKNSIGLSTDGSIIAGKNVTISSGIMDSALAINNLGQITSTGGDIDIQASDLTNYGLTTGNGIITAFSSNNDRFSSGSSNSLNINDSGLEGSAQDGSENINSSGNISINVQNDLLNLSGQITADNNININAGGDIVSQTTTKRAYLDVGFDRESKSRQNGFTEGNGKDFFDALGQSAWIKAGSDINISAGVNINSDSKYNNDNEGVSKPNDNPNTSNVILIGSTLEAGNNVTIETVGSFIATAIQLTNKTTSISGSHGNIFNNQKEQTFNLNYSVSNYGSDINIENNLTITSGLPSPLTKDDGNNNLVDTQTSNSSILIHGSDVNSKGDTILTTNNGNVVIASAQDIDIDIKQTTARKRDVVAATVGTVVATVAAVFSGGVSRKVLMAGSGAGFMDGVQINNEKITSTITSSITQVGSNMNINGDLIINSDKDFLLSSSNLTVSNDLKVNANEFIIEDLNNYTITTTNFTKIKPNYAGVVIEAGIAGALAGFMAQDSVTGASGLDKGAVGAATTANNNDYISSLWSVTDKINTIIKPIPGIGTISTPVEKVSGMTTNNLTGNILGLNPTVSTDTSVKINYTKSSSSVVVNGMQNFNVGNGK